MAAPATPKPRSGAFNKLYKRLCAEIDAPTLVVLLYSALDRGRLEAIYNKVAPRQGPRAQVLGKEELVGAVGGWFFSSVDVAHAVVRDLDRTCKKERHIVSSLPDGDLATRLERYQALDFRRERAKLAWALLRDDRAEAQGLATPIFVEMVAAAQDGEVADTRRRDAEGEDEREKGLRERLEAYEAYVSEARGKLRGLEGQVVRLERERAELIGNIGRKENALRAEEAQRREAEERLVQAERRVRELEEARAALDPEELERLVEERNRLAQRLRRMEKKGRAVQELERLIDENTALKQELGELATREETVRQERQGLMQTLLVRERATQDRMGRLRDALKTARRMALTSTEGAGPARRREGERIGIFVDAANLSASATRAFGGAFDFRRRPAADGLHGQGEEAEPAPRRDGQGRLGHGHRDGRHRRPPSPRHRPHRLGGRRLRAAGAAAAPLAQAGRGRCLQARHPPRAQAHRRSVLRAERAPRDLSADLEGHPALRDRRRAA